MTNITQLTKLIHEDIKRCEGDDWLEGVISLCEHLWEVRKTIPSDQLYGEWIDATPLTWNRKRMGRNIRQGLVSLGKNMEKHEDKIRDIIQNQREKSIDIPAIKTLTKNSLGEEYEEPREVAGKTATDETPTKSKGKGKKRKQKTIKQRVEEASAKKIEEQKQYYEELLRKKDIDHDFNFHDDMVRRFEQVVLPARNKNIIDSARFLKSRKGILTIEEYNLLLRCLHPDVVAKLNDPIQTRRFNDALRLLTDKKVFLLPEKYAPTPNPVLLPETWEEFKKAYPHVEPEKAQ
jgi:hypothetical protein